MKKQIACALAILTAFSTIFLTDLGTVRANEDIETIAELSYVSTAEDAGGSLSAYGDADTGYSFTTGTISGSALLMGSVNNENNRKFEWSKAEYTIGETSTNVVPIMAAGKKNPWGEEASITIKASSKGYQDVTFSVDMAGSSKAPKNYKLQYSLDNINYTDFDGVTYSIPNENGTKIMETAFNQSLSNDIFADQDTFYLRILTTGNATVNPDDPENDPGFKNATGGEIAINNIRFTAKTIVTATPTPSVTPTVTPTATPTVTPTPSATPVPTVAPSQNPVSNNTNKTVKVKLNKKKVTLKKNKSTKLKVTFTPSSAKKSSKITWSSSKKKVASVSKSGKVTAHKKGTATIRAKIKCATNKKNYTLKCTIKVK